MSKIINVDDAAFNSKVFNSEVPVLAYFTAPWVNECSLLSPVLEELAQEYDGKLRIARIDADQNDVSTQRYNIKAMPTMIVFNNGRVEETVVGTRSKNQLSEMISRYIG